MRPIGRASAVIIGALVTACLPDYPSTQRQSYGGDYDMPSASADPSISAPGATAAPPEFGPTITQADPPPPLSGGTMGATLDGRHVVAADPDRDRVYIVDPAIGGSRTVALQLHDEPARVALDANDRAHVVLRRAGAIATIDVASGAVLERQYVCPMPRGVAYEPARDRIHVACAGGEIVSFAAAGGGSVASTTLLDDLRDVVWSDKRGLIVTTFRSARIISVGAGGEWTEIFPPDSIAQPAAVAWRTIVAPGNTSNGESILMAQQKAPDTDVAVPAEYYPRDGGCVGAGPVTVVRENGDGVLVPPAVLAVDIAATTNLIALAAAGNGHTPGAAGVILLQRIGPTFGCDVGIPLEVPGQITSVVFAQNKLVALSREPASVSVFDALTYQRERTIDFAEPSREDTGHAIFHSSSGAGVACASCHPEGRDDGHSWLSQQLGRRRTPSLAGTIANTAPYHWNGEAADFHAIAVLTFEGRMKGPNLGDDQIAALGSWAFSIPKPVASPAIDPSAASRGQALFGGAAGCTSCHSGAERTNNKSIDIGTGGAFQVPSLVGVWARAPYLHDGSAASLGTVISGPMAGHGETPLSARDVADLAAFLGTF